MTEPDPLDRLYTDLMHAYDLTLDRRKSLTSQASNLMGFTGIIQSVLIALIIAWATNEDVRNLVSTSSDPFIVLLAAGIGFAAYMATVILSAIAFYEPTWTLFPQMPRPLNPNPNVYADISTIMEYFEKKRGYKPQKFAIQLKTATQLNQKTNDLKYNILKFAMVSLMIGIIATIIGGFAMLFVSQGQATLLVKTVVTGSNSTLNGYTASDFTMHINGNDDPSPANFPGSELGLEVVLGVGTYAVTQTGPPDLQYRTTYSQDCAGKIANGEDRTCVVTILGR
jgi:hypothetical protein